MKNMSYRGVKATQMIGLDIGSSAVRAAEISRSRRGLTLERFAQVGLPTGAVEDGEVVDVGTVVTGIRRLWAEGGFTSRRVVLVASGQRAIVRQAEVVAMSEPDFRSALSFQAMDLIPIPVDDAVLDFVIVPSEGLSAGHSDKMRVLLAAVHRKALGNHLTAVREAGLRVVAVDPAPMAAVRAAVRAGWGPDTAAGLVDIGADLTLVTVQERQRTRFSRVLAQGGSDVTSRLAERHALPYAEAESVKRELRTGNTALALLEHAGDLFSEIEGSLNFFSGQLESGHLRSVALTGGASRSPEFLSELARRLPQDVTVLDCLANLDLTHAGLSEEQERAASASALLAIGAAEWAFEVPSRRLSLLPREIAIADGVRRRSVAVGACLVVLAGALSAVSFERHQEVSAARARADAARVDTETLQAEVDRLAPVATYTAAVHEREAEAVGFAADDVNWAELLSEITAKMPRGTELTALNFVDDSGAGTAGTATGSPSASSSSAASSGPVALQGSFGTVSMSVKGPGSEEEVAVWLRALSQVKGLSTVWVPSSQVGSGSVTFTSTGSLTLQAPMISRRGLGS